MLPVTRHVQRSEPDSRGNVTLVLSQAMGKTRYFDAAGYPGRTLRLPEGAAH
jgi:hypothetical protein